LRERNNAAYPGKLTWDVGKNFPFDRRVSPATLRFGSWWFRDYSSCV
jgi:hypothetical protein